MSSSDQPPKLSIIIPTLNEEECLANCLESIDIQAYTNDLEVIICDGDSSDTTLQIASKFPITIIHNARGRGLQMNAGARCARGKTLLFLHAETQLPPAAPKTPSSNQLKAGIPWGGLPTPFSPKLNQPR